MVTLVLDASNGHLSVACFKNNKLLSEINEDCNKNLSEIILSRVDNVLKNADIDKKSISKIIITNGPGSYTGLRVVLSIAKTMAKLLNVNIHVVSSLLLQSVVKQQNAVRVSIMDGRRGNVYGAIYKDETILLSEGYYTFDYIIEKINNIGEDVIIIGNDIDKFDYNGLNSNYALEKKHIYSRNVIFVEQFLEEVNADDVKPNYLRETEAERNLKNDKDK